MASKDRRHADAASEGACREGRGGKAIRAVCEGSCNRGRGDVGEFDDRLKSPCPTQRSTQGLESLGGTVELIKRRPGQVSPPTTTQGVSISQPAVI
jgi:hypothetical protein